MTEQQNRADQSEENGITIADQVTVGLAGGKMSIYVGGIPGSSTQVVLDISAYIV